MFKPKRLFSLCLAVLMVCGLSLTALAEGVPVIETKDDTVYIYLVRHGRTFFNTIGRSQGWVDTPLTEAGVVVAEDTAMGLADVKFDAVFSSDRGRAIHTAEIILNHNAVTGNLPIHELADLRETNFGKFDGMDNMGMLQIGIEAQGGTFPDGLETMTNAEIIEGIAMADDSGAAETYEQMYTRVMRGLKQVATSVPSGNVLVTAHGLVIVDILHSVGITDINSVDNSSVSVITYKNGKFAATDVVNSLEWHDAGAIAREQNDGAPVIPEGKTVVDTSVIPEAGSGAVNMYFVRHGKTSLNTYGKMQGISDSPLTEAGVQGVVNTGLGLKDIKFDALFSSTMQRTVETIDLMLSANKATAADVPRTKVNNLREFEFGTYEAQSEEEAHKELLALLGVSNYVELAEKGYSIFDMFGASPETEDADTFKARVWDGVEYVAHSMSQQSGETNVMVAVHGIVMSAIADKLGITVAGAIPNAAVLKVTFKDGKYTVSDAGIDLSYSEAGQKLNPLAGAKYNMLGGQSASTRSVNIGSATVSVPTYSIGGFTYVPLRKVCEAVGADVTWDAHTSTAVVILNGIRMAIKLNTNQYYVDTAINFMSNGAFSTLCVEGEYANSTFIPLEYLAQAFGIN